MRFKVEICGSWIIWYIYRVTVNQYNSTNSYLLWHRLDGIAFHKLIDDSKYWYYMGKEINCHSQEEFERIIRLKAFM